VDVVVGYNDIIDGDEVTTTPPAHFLFPGYPATKYKAECDVLQANGTNTHNGGALLLNLSYKISGIGQPYFFLVISKLKKLH